MTLEKFIHLKENFIPDLVNNQFLRICKSKVAIYEEGRITGQIGDKHHVNKKVRNTYTWTLANNNYDHLTMMHWTNYFGNYINQAMNEYMMNFTDCFNFKLIDMQVLKYNEGGFYHFHVDHGPSVPRTISSIYLINDDYEGGELIFKHPISKEELKIEKKKNTLIMWPSNFLYPHKVLPVKQGVRYSMVAWAL